MGIKAWTKEVLIRTGAAGICHSDALFNGTYQEKFPWCSVMKVLE